MLEPARLVAFVPSRDLEASHRFYAGVLGLPMVESSEIARAYDAGGALLRVTRVETVVAVPYTVLGWQVDDIVATMRRLDRAGVSFKRYSGMVQDEHGLWDSPGGSRVAWFDDPDGNTLSLQQPPRPR